MTTAALLSIRLTSQLLQRKLMRETHDKLRAELLGELALDKRERHLQRSVEFKNTGDWMTA